MKTTSSPAENDPALTQPLLTKPETEYSSQASYVLSDPSLGQPIQNTYGMSSANDAPRRAPKKDKAKKGWFRWFGGLAYEEVRNYVGWFGSLAMTGGAIALFNTLFGTTIATFLAATGGPVVLIPIALVQAFLPQIISVSDALLNQSVEGVNKAIPDKHAKDGKDSWQDFFRKLFGITKFGVNEQVKPRGLRKLIGDTAYFRIASATVDVMGFVGGFVNAVKNVGIVYLITRLVSMAVFPAATFATMFPAAHNNIGNLVTDVIKVTGMAYFAKKGLEIVGTWGYNIAGWGLDKVYGGAEATVSFAGAKAYATSVGKNVYDSGASAYNYCAETSVGKALTYARDSVTAPFSNLRNNVNAYANDVDYTKKEVATAKELGVPVETVAQASRSTFRATNI